MRKNYDRQNTKKLLKKHGIDKFFSNMDLPFYTIEYEKGEFLQHPNNANDLFQIGISGEISLYYIRPDGEKYFLAQN